MEGIVNCQRVCWMREPGPRPECLALYMIMAEYMSKLMLKVGFVAYKVAIEHPFRFGSHIKPGASVAA